LTGTVLIILYTAGYSAFCVLSCLDCAFFIYYLFFYH